MSKIVTIVGARPQFIKAAMVSRAMKDSGIREVILHTGQHYDQNMSDIFFEEMMIPKPDHRLNISGLSHGTMTGRMMEGIEGVLVKERPTYVMVFGDTNSTLAGALAAAKLGINVVHVEAGLRSHNMRMPEELNRILTDRISSILFCPTEQSILNLQKEGFDNFNVDVVRSGDVMQDAAIFYSKISQRKSRIMADLELVPDDFVLATVHRQENTDDLAKLGNIFRGLASIHKRNRVILPLHPRTREILKINGITPNADIIEPVGYFDMLELLKHCKLVVTDSGGLQKEAFFFRKHCITVREETEWVELVDGGFNAVVGANPEKITQKFEELSVKDSNFDLDLYGNGHAAQDISKFLVRKMGQSIDNR